MYAARNRIPYGMIVNAIANARPPHATFPSPPLTSAIASKVASAIASFISGNRTNQPEDSVRVSDSPR